MKAIAALLPAMLVLSTVPAEALVALPPAGLSVSAVQRYVLPVQAPNTKSRLTTAIEDLRSGSPNMTQYEPMLRVAIQQQKQKIDAYLSAMGKVTDVTFVGAQNGGDVFQVTFENGASAWWIQLAPNGKIAGLYFQ